VVTFGRVLVLVVVAVVGGVAVTVVEVVDMIFVGGRLVPATLAVDVVVLGVVDVGESMLVEVAVVADMGVTIVDVVGVTFMRNSDMPAVGPVLVSVIGMDSVFSGGHVCSLEWLTASTTMWATWASMRE
jgi:hypothetical protein